MIYWIINIKREKEIKFLGLANIKAFQNLIMLILDHHRFKINSKISIITNQLEIILIEFFAIKYNQEYLITFNNKF